MRVGIPTEIKDNEHRVGLTPAGVAALVQAGHEVCVERGGGSHCGFDDAAYVAAGARLTDAEIAWGGDLVVKVKEPQESEYGFFRGQIVFTYLHLAGGSRALTEALLASRTIAVAYETVADEKGRWPLLAPMSAIAGSMAPLVGAHHLAHFRGGRGVLLGQVLGRRHGRVMIVGDGVVGQHAASVASAMGAHVRVFGLTEARGAELRSSISPDLEYVISTPETLAEYASSADLLVGAVLVAGARAPHIISEAMIQSMAAGAVVVDVSIDQGGCIESSEPTSHSKPTFVKHDVIHYCVTNMPGAYPRTSTLALTDATLPYVLRLANRGTAAFRDDVGFANGVNTLEGYLTCRPVADAFGWQNRYRPVVELLS
jgi:alanine dehydrogenase